MAQQDELIGPREVAELMNVAVDTVYSMRHRGNGPVGWRRGKRLVFKRGDVEAFLAHEREHTLRGQVVVRS
ncbi:helix-turn-helix transcriptional regulator [Mycobacterium sp. Aquia_213]|uniref:helix-turn-helix transcriptional regulator n=1 Tax=Mycobacterium sp. Aquia_213 TaxID=2991728 RepID=UPI00226D536E|nr:helix-turn-helix domain-containing protein [Mycobacterium sp. Aquia_213]WAC93573.1 helix-turn-helix domain-containing protein [Mycobacterium sp. Aquia_213]